MPDKHQPYHYPTPVLLYPVLGSFFCAQTQPTLAAMQRSGLASCNIMSAYVGLAAYWGGRLS